MSADSSTIDYSTVTELSGDDVSSEQIERLCHRYYWAKSYCIDKDVIEVACGTGAGLGLLNSVASSLRAGDYTESILNIAVRHYGDKIDLRRFDAQAMPYADASADVIIIFEAIYYLPDVNAFIQECCRVLRPDGVVLIATANKDLYDFNPSPYSHRYFGVKELNELFVTNGFRADFFGYLSVKAVSWKQKVLRPIKKFAVEWNLIPQNMAGKKLLKRLVFGSLQPMPLEIADDMIAYVAPQPLQSDRPDVENKVIYCAAQRQ